MEPAIPSVQPMPTPDLHPTTCACSSCQSATKPPFPYVYAIGQVQPRFPTLGLEKEFSQTVGRAATTGQGDRQAFYAVVNKSENRYLVRQLCWVFSVAGIDTYILQPRDPSDFQLLANSVRSQPRLTDIDVVVGLRGNIAPPELCNGLAVPIVGFDKLYSFDADSFVKKIPRPENTSQETFTPVAEELLSRIMQIADNTGSSDDHRALNYLAVRYDAIYARVADAFNRNFALTAVSSKQSQLGGSRKIMEVVFSFSHRDTDVTEKSFVRVDVTDEFPFLVTKLSPYFDR